MAASTGTLVAAGLESAGYKAQSIILDQLWLLLLAVSVAVFVWVACRAIWIHMLTGQVRPAIWALVGPTLLLFMLDTRTMSGGVEWQFGTYKGDQRRVQEFVQGNIASNVSLPFDLYNRFVSGISGSMIGLALDNPVSSTILFTVRQQIYDLIMNVDVVTPGLRSLIHEGLQGKCGEWMSAARKLARGSRDPVYMGTPDYLNSLQTYATLRGNASVSLQPDGPAYKYVLELLNSITAAGQPRSEAEGLVRTMCEGQGGVLPGTGATGVDVLNAPASCGQIWCWSAIGLVLEARSALDESLNETVGQNPAYQGMTPAARAAILQQILEDIAKKVSPDPDPVTGTRFDNDPSVIPIVIAGRLLSQELSRDPRGSLYDEFAEHSRVKVQAYQPQLQLSESELANMREQSSEYEGTVGLYAKTLSLAYSLPYLQGSILFALALLFPFFAIASLLPRRQSTIVFWAAAWMWVKMWDVGWAVVMLIDQVLWELMPHRAYYQPVALGMHSPLTILESAFDTDPTYSLATYYALLAFLLMAIPTVTGQLMLKGAGSVAQYLLAGLSQNVMDPYAGGQASRDERDRARVGDHAERIDQKQPGTEAEARAGQKALPNRNAEAGTQENRESNV